jgi:solute carrier family 35 protein F1/2
MLPLDILFALIDVEGNYFMVKAFSYTSLLSAMLLDTWTIPCVMLLSVFFLKMRFIRWHYLGVFTCLVGMGILIWSDMTAGKNFPGSDYLKGDLFCLAGATCYALSNVLQEYLVRQKPMYEVVGQLGFWATIINGIQLAILEREELQSITWTGPVVGYIIGFNIGMFILYSVSPILLRLSSATFFNLSLLTSDFYGLIFGLILFSAQVRNRVGVLATIQAPWQLFSNTFIDYGDIDARALSRFLRPDYHWNHHLQHLSSTGAKVQAKAGRR